MHHGKAGGKRENIILIYHSVTSRKPWQTCAKRFQYAIFIEVSMLPYIATHYLMA